MGLHCKCFNCHKLITQTDLDNKIGYKFGEEKAVCDKCYLLFFDKVRDYLYDNPGSDMDKIHNNNGVSNSLITLFLNEGALETAVQELTVQRIAQAEQEKQEEQQRLQKLTQINELRNLMNDTHKVEDSKPASNGPRMRYVENDNKNRRRF